MAAQQVSNRRCRGIAALCTVAAGAIGVQAFVSLAQPRPSSSSLRGEVAFEQPLPSSAAATNGAEHASLLVGAWAFAGLSAALASRVTCRAQETEQKSAEVEKKPFNVWEPDTYGNITMDDVKKYGAAGTLSYVITELLFWAIAFPTECFVYLNTAGHWPDFSKPEESAAVFGLVFAASNIARLLLPLRFGAALAMAPWVDENIMKKFSKQEEKASEGA